MPEEKVIVVVRSFSNLEKKILSLTVFQPLSAFLLAFQYYLCVGIVICVWELLFLCVCVCARIKHIVICKEDGSSLQRIKENSEPLCQHK